MSMLSKHYNEVVVPHRSVMLAAKLMENTGGDDIGGGLKRVMALVATAGLTGEFIELYEIALIDKPYAVIDEAGDVLWYIIDLAGIVMPDIIFPSFEQAVFNQLGTTAASHDELLSLSLLEIGHVNESVKKWANHGRGLNMPSLAVSLSKIARAVVLLVASTSGKDITRRQPPVTYVMVLDSILKYNREKLTKRHGDGFDEHYAGGGKNDS